MGVDAAEGACSGMAVGTACDDCCAAPDASVGRETDVGLCVGTVDAADDVFVVAIGGTIAGPSVVGDVIGEDAGVSESIGGG